MKCKCALVEFWKEFAPVHTKLKEHFSVEDVDLTSGEQCVCTTDDETINVNEVTVEE
jgi:NADH/NAD ratio-sensing transcriptional regulator Rex